MLEPACMIDDISLEELFEDLRKISRTFKKAAKESSLEATNEALTEHLLNVVLPVAKSHPSINYIHCEPREVYICKTREGCLGTRSMDLIKISEKHLEDVRVPSIIVHESCHALTATSEESYITLLGCDIDARLALAGYGCHRMSLFKILRSALAHTSYLKAKEDGRVDEWKEFIGELYGNELTESDIDEEIEHFEQAEEENMFGVRLSHYTARPYLALKGAIRSGSNYAINEYFLLSGESIKEKVDISSLLQVWNDVMNST